MRMNLKKLPSASKVYSVSFPRLSGGLNLRDLGYLVDGDESPNMRNLVWRDGLLQSRDGQLKVAQAYHTGETDNTCYAVYENLFHGYAFFHVGSTIRCLAMDEPLTEPFDPENALEASLLVSGVPSVRGSFFQYQGSLYYKNEGGFFIIDFNEDGGTTVTTPASFNLSVCSKVEAPVFDLFVYELTENSGKFERVDPTSLASVLADINGKTIALRHKETGYLLTPDNTPTYQVSSSAEDFTLTAADTGAKNAVFTCVVSNGNLYLQGAGIVPGASSDKYLTATYATGDIVFGPSALPSIPNGPMKWALEVSFSLFGVCLYNKGFRVIDHGDHLFSGAGGFTQKQWYVRYSPQRTPASVPFVCHNLNEVAEETVNAPVILINASPANGSGTIYQPENRLSSKKTVWYNGDGATTTYHLPVTNIDDVVYVEKEGSEVVSPAYTADMENGTITFTSAPAAGNNNVRITYSKFNETALTALLLCRYAIVASGGESAQFIVLGGCSVQPDAIFWNANDELAIQPWYFPMDCYNLVGTAGDPVTGFGRQYNDTLVFSDHTVGKLSYGAETVDGRATPSFGYERVNSKIGCDLPWTIQQVENNVVFCNSYRGAHIVLSSSAAYENNIQCLSDKINKNGNADDPDIAGLLDDIRNSQTEVISFDDDERYWICANGKVYVWDYEVSTYADPSWFYWTDISPVGLFHDNQHNAYHLDTSGGVQAFLPTRSDNGLAIDKLYQFPTMHFDTYSRLKDVTDLVMSFRSDVLSQVTVLYDTELEQREDQTPVVVLPENYQTRTGRHAVHVAKRRPKCLHVRQFGLTLSNNLSGEELALVSAEIFYRFVGKER